MLTLAGPALAQGQPGDWKVNVYPVLAWLPINIGIDVNVPRDIGGGSGGGAGLLDTSCLNLNRR